MSGVTNRTVTDGEDGSRLDRWFKQHYPSLARGRLEKLLRTGQIRVDGGRVKAGHRLRAGQTVRVPPLVRMTMQARLLTMLSKRQQSALLQTKHRLQKVVTLTLPLVSTKNPMRMSW